MSELTRCNYHALLSMKQRLFAVVDGDVLKFRKRRVYLERGSKYNMPGWTAARYANGERPSAFFLV